MKASQESENSDPAYSRRDTITMGSRAEKKELITVATLFPCTSKKDQFRC